jgi:hypothetical protein
VVLTSGETLLVGGLGRSGNPMSLLEIVDPLTRRSRTNGLGLLAVPRSQPQVLRLASGEILVAGGFDRTGTPVPTLEWFSPDGTPSTKRRVDLVSGRDRAFVPLEAGGALAVVAPEGEPDQFGTVWVLTPDGSLEPGVPLDPRDLKVVRLYPGADGAPVLFTGERWMRWQPWLSAFERIADAPERGPSLDAVASGDSGLALWLDDQGTAGMYVVGYRFATRTRFAAVSAPLLVTGPGGLAPDRPAGSPGSSIRWAPEVGLELGPGASAFLTDLTFADFEVDLEISSAAPYLVLRQEDGRELEVGGAPCAIAQAAVERLQVQRVGRRVRVRVDDGELRLCPAELDRADMRVSLGLRGAQGSLVSGARALRVSRR